MGGNCFIAKYEIVAACLVNDKAAYMFEEDKDGFLDAVERCVLRYGRNLPGVPRQTLPGVAQSEYEIKDADFREKVEGADFMKAYAYRDGAKQLPQDLVLGASGEGPCYNAQMCWKKVDKQCPGEGATQSL